MSKVNQFKARVELLCKKRGWTLRELARQMDKSPQGLHDVLQRGDPKASLLREFGQVLDVGPDELLEDVSPAEYGEEFMPTMDEE